MREQEGRQEPEGREDAKNITTIAVSALLGVMVTGGLLLAMDDPDPRPVVVEMREIPAPRPVTPAVAEPAPEPLVAVAGNARLYGTVTTRDGWAHRGYIRWDKNEGSWSDLLDANKLHRNRGATQAGIRFGHVRRIESTGHDGAVFTLKSGEAVRLSSRSTDLGSGLRAIQVVLDDGSVAELGWRDLESVDFEAAPEDTPAREARLYGTLTTRTGRTFTGHVTWDVDEIYSTDILDGDQDGRRHELSFGSIEVIERHSGSAARVVLRSGEELTLRGTNDVNSSNNGISVSDEALGQVKVDWDDFESVRFHEPGAESGYAAFDGGGAIRGTLVTDAGEFTGEVRWDRDETQTWEMLNGSEDGVEYQIEFSRIARIERTSRGAHVELLDGRSFELRGSNDVDDGNRGISVLADGREVSVSWEDFRELRLQH